METITTPEVCSVIENNLPLVGKVVGQLRAKGLPHWVDAEELTAEANLALCLAAHEGITDAPLLRNYIHASLVDYLRKENVRQRDVSSIDGSVYGDDGDLHPLGQSHGTGVSASGARVTLAGLNDEEDMRVKKLALNEALRTLPDQDRKILTMYYFEGINQEQIAARPSVDHSTVSRSIAKSLAALKKTMEPTHKTEGAKR